MRQAIAALVLLCFGITVPTAATQLRICLMDGQLFADGASCVEDVNAQKDSCCPDDGDENDNCCAELRKLPDSTLRSGIADLPDLAVSDLPTAPYSVPSVLVSESPSYQPSVPIRGPDSPCAYRAILAVWTI